MVCDFLITTQRGNYDELYEEKNPPRPVGDVYHGQKILGNGSIVSF